MKALAVQITVWAEEPEATARRRKHFVIDVDAWARMFRNDLHNMALFEQIEERAAHRREMQINDLRREASRAARSFSGIS